MKTPTNDPHTKWKPVNGDAAKMIRPATADEVFTERTQRPPAMTGNCHTADVLTGKVPILRTGQKIGKITIEGLTLKGRILGQCDCGRWQLFLAATLITPLMTKKERKKKIPMCIECHAIQAAVKREEDTGALQILVT